MEHPKEEVFERNGNFYVIRKDKHESRESYLERVWFVLNRINKNDVDKKNIDELCRLSRVWINTKLYNCEYSEKIMNLIN